ncbi:MAG: hypothetical protein HC888_13160, partial [Candidatus Competibacteraceae bacterium]|nr:hypothetical protein [Candidatus Competibacteraceae bacterium]
MHDVGTLRASSGQRLGGTLPGIETPTLLGVHATAPYFHNGSAAMLEEVFQITGGLQVQAEDGTPGNGAVIEDVEWAPMKEWHNGYFVNLGGSGSTATLSFDNIQVDQAGPGHITVRYNAGYGLAQLDLSINGANTSANLAMTPNFPGWMANEWREARIPVTYAEGLNTITFARGPRAAASCCSTTSSLPRRMTRRSRKPTCVD